MTNEEKIEQERKKLVEEDLTKFPSIFQQARNLAKQAWVSGTGVLQGKAFLTTAEKAYARLEICKTCEFFKDTRCLKCGCFMEKKAHIELASCPVNKWGPELQVMLTQAQMDGYNTSIKIVNLATFSEEDSNVMKLLAENALKNGNGVFSYKLIEYRARYKNGKSGEYFISINQRMDRKTLTSNMTDEQKKEFYNLAKQVKDLNGPKTFVYDGIEYRVTAIEGNRMSIGFASNPPRN